MERSFAWYGEVICCERKENENKVMKLFGGNRSFLNEKREIS